MLTVALAVLALLLLTAAGTLAVLWRSARLQVVDLTELLDATLRELDGYQSADDDTLRLPPPAAVAALAPDAEPPIPAGWLDDLNTLPTTSEREYPR